MNKNYFLNLLTFMMVAMLCVSFVSCGDDDDDNGGAEGLKINPSSTPAPTIIGSDGKAYKLLSIGSQYKFTYDTNGILTSMENSSLPYSVSESSFVYTNNTSGNNGTTVNVALGTNGLVSRISYEYVKSPGGGNHKENGQFSFTYDNEKQLVGINGSISANWIDEKQREGWQRITVKQNNEWENGNLTRVSVVKTGKHKEETDAEESDYNNEKTYSFSYGNTENNIRQMPYRIAEKLSVIDGVDMLGILGFLGVGPSKFPSSDGTGYKLSYSTNSNGTIYNEELINDNYGGKGTTMTYPHKYVYE